MIQSGVTTDGNKVVTGVFKLVGTHGTPLEMILDWFKYKGMVIDWVDYIADALKDGHKPETVKSRILAAVGDVYGGKYASEIEKRLDVVL